MNPFQFRIYYEDTDAGGVVYHANYLRFFERARSEWLLAHGLSYRELKEQHALLLVVTEVQLRFIRPARLEDSVDIQTELVECGRVRLGFAQELIRGSDRLATLGATVAAVHAESFKPARLPEPFLSRCQTLARPYA